MAVSNRTFLVSKQYFVVSGDNRISLHHYFVMHMEQRIFMHMEILYFAIIEIDEFVWDITFPIL
jgi:hypothetical protein